MSIDQKIAFQTPVPNDLIRPARPKPLKKGTSSRIALILRRTHMFVALFLTPWMTMYALSNLVVLATLVWIASGLYLWVGLKRFRFWGWVALGGGMASFLILVLGL